MENTGVRDRLLSVHELFKGLVSSPNSSDPHVPCTECMNHEIYNVDRYELFPNMKEGTVFVRRKRGERTEGQKTKEKESAGCSQPSVEVADYARVQDTE